VSTLTGWRPSREKNAWLFMRGAWKEDDWYLTMPITETVSTGSVRGKTLCRPSSKASATRRRLLRWVQPVSDEQTSHCLPFTF
jgi:hypothetical protein